MADSKSLTSQADESRRIALGPVDLETAELEINGSIYEGFAAAITVKGHPRTVALTREYGDAVQLMALIERGRAPLLAVNPTGLAMPPTVFAKPSSVGRSDGPILAGLVDVAEAPVATHEARTEALAEAIYQRPDSSSQTDWSDLAPQYQAKWRADAERGLAALASLDAQPQTPAEDGKADAKAFKRAFWQLAFDAVPAHDNPGDCKWRLSSTAVRILADAAVNVVSSRHEAPEEAMTWVPPVAWVIRTKDGHVRMWTMSEERARTAAEAWGMEAKQEGLSPITHPAPDALRGMDRDALIALIMEETNDDIVADGWDRLGKPNVLVQGCRYIRRNAPPSPEGYENPEASAKQFAGFIADRFLAALRAEQKGGAA